MLVARRTSAMSATPKFRRRWRRRCGIVVSTAVRNSTGGRGETHASPPSAPQAMIFIRGESQGSLARESYGDTKVFRCRLLEPRLRGRSDGGAHGVSPA